jgi:hypothetical protein
VFTDVVDCADVGVIQGGRGLRLALESHESVRISGYILTQKLERDETAEASILSLIDDSHPAATKPFNDAVVRDGLANHCLGIRSWRGMLGCAQKQVNVGDEPIDSRMVGTLT